MAERKQVFAFPVTYEAAPEGGYVAFVPSLPGCHTQGETLEEAEANVKEAIEVYLDSLEPDERVRAVAPRILQGRVEIVV